VLVIPNHKYLTTTLFNWTENDKVTGESINVGVAYGTDVEKFKKVVLEIAMQHPDATKKKEPILLFQDFGDSSLDFTLIVFTENAFKGAMIKSDIRFAIEKALKRNGIEIPFPQRVIHTPK
jgi:small-conductance mechanosensitive channel